MGYFLVVFAATLLVAVFFSALTHRTVLSTAVLFLAVGMVVGHESLGVLNIDASSDAVSTLAQLALFVVLFTDGTRTGWRELQRAWRLPGRTLLVGLPLTLVITALLAHLLLGLGWPESFLLGAILAPTDPVFAAAIVGNKKVPSRLRHLLNVESGLNDGLALPLVMVFLALSGGSDEPITLLILELTAGAAIGVALPWLVLRALRTRAFGAAGVYEPLIPVAIGIAVFAASIATGANLYIAAFTAGVTLATVGPTERAALEPIGEVVAELLKLAALMVFGALISLPFLAEVPWGGWVLGVLAIVLARPLALFVAFLGSKLPVREQVVAMWFGPKGFASVVYVLIVLGSGIESADLIFHVVAITIVLSILAHSSTDVVIARGFENLERAAELESTPESTPESETGATG